MLEKRNQRENTQTVKKHRLGRIGLVLAAGIFIALFIGCANMAEETVESPMEPAPGDDPGEPLIFEPEEEETVEIAAAEPEEEPIEPEEEIIEPDEEEPLIIPDEEEPIEDPEDLLIPDTEGEENGFEEARPQLEQQLQQQVINEYVMEHISDVRDESEIDIDQDVLETGEGDEVVAVVNEEEIQMDQVLESEQQQLQQLQMMGLDLDDADMDEFILRIRPDVLNDIINTVLVVQRAEDAGMAATDDMIEQQYQMFIEQAGGEGQMQAQLEQAEISEEELKEMIGHEISVQQYLDSYLQEHLDPEDLEFTEEELREIYDSQQQMQQMQQMQQ